MPATKTKAPAGKKLGRASVWQAEFGDLVIIDGWNSREDYGDIEELARQIEAQGVREALRGYRTADGKIAVTDGHRRHKAMTWLYEHKSIEIKRVPIVLEDRGGSDADRLATQILSNSGKPLSPLEESNVLAKLQAYGWNVDEMVEKLGFTAGKVKDRLLLATATDDVKQQIRKGELSATAAAEAVRGSMSDAEVAEVMNSAKEMAKSDKTPVTTEHVRQAKRERREQRTPEQIQARVDELATKLKDVDWESLPLSVLERIDAAVDKATAKLAESKEES